MRTLRAIHVARAPRVSRAGRMTLLEHPFDPMPIQARTRCAFWPVDSSYLFSLYAFLF